ncbi:MAG: hypothetical protein WC389_20070 [Lutibacter sp.]|jgi:hypothetical protein
MKKLITLSIFMLLSIVSVFSQDDKIINPGKIDGILNWVIGIGIPGILAMLFGVWKKAPAFIGKVAAVVVVLLDNLSNLLVQVTEANMSVRNEVAKLKTYAADGKYDQKELEDIVSGLEKSLKEINDVPIAIRNLKIKVKEAIENFKK